MSITSNISPPNINLKLLKEGIEAFRRGQFDLLSQWIAILRSSREKDHPELDGFVTQIREECHRGLMEGCSRDVIILAAMCLAGIDDELDEACAAELLDWAIAQGHPEAMNRRALMYVKERSYGDAIVLFERAIVLGNVNALCNRASMYERAQGGLINYTKAIAMYKDAIEKGCIDAINKLAYMYEHGFGGERNYDAAISHYEQAIEMGHAEAMVNRAYCG